MWWAAVLIIALLVVTMRAAKFNTGWFLAAILIFAFTVTANNLGGDFISLNDYIPDTRFNWDGKLAEILIVLTMVIFLKIFVRSIKLSDHGFTMRQTEGSFVPMMVMTMLLVGAMSALTFAFSGPSQASTAQIVETLAFQSTLPGLSEEPLFRGLLLTALSMAVVSRGVNVFGAQIGWGGVLATLLFTVAHGIYWGESGLQISADAMIITSFLGFGLLWIRQRTGSLIMPIIAHNLINVSSNIVEFFVI